MAVWCTTLPAAMHHFGGMGAPWRRCLTSGESVCFARSGCRTTNGQGVVLARCTHSENEVFFFLNRDGKRLSEQSVRRIVNRYTNLAQQSGHYTPHMFRHSFATYLWDTCGDVYEVKEILGHSSIK